MRNRARLLVLVLLFCCLLFFAESVYARKSVLLRALSQSLLVIPLLAWLIGLVRSGQGIPRTPMDYPLLGLLAAALVASLAGLSLRYSLETMWIYVVYVLGFWLFVQVRRTRWQSLLLTALFLSAGAVCLVAVIEWASWYLGLPFAPNVVVGWPEIGGWQDPFPSYSYRVNLIMGGSTPL